MYSERWTNQVGKITSRSKPNSVCEVRIDILSFHCVETFHIRSQTKKFTTFSESMEISVRFECMSFSLNLMDSYLVVKPKKPREQLLQYMKTFTMRKMPQNIFPDLMLVEDTWWFSISKLLSMCGGQCNHVRRANRNANVEEREKEIEELKTKYGLAK